MRELIIGGRTITVSHIETEATEYGDIQRYRIDLTGSDAVTHLSSLRSSRIARRRKRLIQANVCSMTHWCLPSRWLLSMPRRAIRCLIPRWRQARRQRR